MQTLLKSVIRTAITISIPSALPLSAANLVLPPGANPHGTTLADMAEKLALFDSSGNNLAYYPATPFRILFQDPAKQTVAPVVCQESGQGYRFMGGNTFVASPGQAFFVPLFSVDDSPPIVGNFPSAPSGAASYFFGPTELGGRNFEVIVDGQSAAIGPAFVAGPVNTPPLLDGGGTHLIQLGVFLTLLSPGTHVVTIRGKVGGSTLLAAYGFSCLEEDFTYSVNVTRGPTVTKAIPHTPSVMVDYAEASSGTDVADPWRKVYGEPPEPGVASPKHRHLTCPENPVPRIGARGLCVQPPPRP